MNGFSSGITFLLKIFEAYNECPPPRDFFPGLAMVTQSKLLSPICHYYPNPLLTDN